MILSYLITDGCNFLFMRVTTQHVRHCVSAIHVCMCVCVRVICGKWCDSYFSVNYNYMYFDTQVICTSVVGV